jgi:hypothetical protein
MEISAQDGTEKEGEYSNRNPFVRSHFCENSDFRGKNHVLWVAYTVWAAFPTTTSCSIILLDQQDKNQ